MAGLKEKKLLKTTEKCQIWWVNHGRTFTKAKDGGYLWVPMPVKGGNTFAHWESVNYVNPGDLVLNFSRGSIVAFGIAKGKVEKHIEESNNKNMPGKEGRRVNLDFYDLADPIDIEELRPYIAIINQSIEANQPFNSFKAVNNGYLFNFSIKGMNIIAEKFMDRIPERIVSFLENIFDTDFSGYLSKNGFVFDPWQIKNYIISLHTKPFVLLTGNPGLGKTKLAQKYAQYIAEKNKEKTETRKDTTFLKRRWFKLSYNDKNLINAFQGSQRKIDQLRNTMLNDGLIPLGWDNRDLNQKKVIKDLMIGDVIVAYQGAYIVGGIAIVTQPHFFDETGDAYDTFCESSKNFIRVEWIFAGPLKIKDFNFKEYSLPGFGMWVNTIHEMTKDQAHQFLDYLETKNIKPVTNGIAELPKNYEIVPVGAHWKAKDELIGCFDNSIKEYVKTKALELILNAKKTMDAGLGNPFFLILDEMNLSNIDHYFSDFLSVLESGEKIILHGSDDIEQDAGIPKELGLPLNLFIVGIVNRDNNSWQLSQKLIDRANIIEFENIPVRNYLRKIKTRNFNKDLPFPEISELNLMSPAEIFEKMVEVTIEDKPEKFNEKIIKEIELFQNSLKNAGFDISLRLINEIIRYLYISWQLDNQPKHWDAWAEAFDAQILQRLLPKIYGSETIIQDQLKCLYCCCFSGKTSEQLERLEKNDFVDELLNLNWQQARYKFAAKKLKRMQKMMAS